MTVLIPAEGPFYHQDGSFLGVSGQAACLVIQLQQAGESGPPVPQNLDGRLFVQRILDGEGQTLLEITGVNRTSGQVAFTLTSDDAANLLPLDGVIALDLTHVVGELVLEGFDPILTAPFSLHRLRRGLGATVLTVEPGEDVVIVRYAGAPPLSLLEELIAAGDLPEGAVHEDMLAVIQKPATDAVTEGAGAIASAKAGALAAIGEGDTQGARGNAITAIGAAGDDQVERITGLGALLTQVTYHADGTITEIINGVTTTYTYNADGTISRTIGAPVNATVTTTFTANGISEA